MVNFRFGAYLRRTRSHRGRYRADLNESSTGRSTSADCLGEPFDLHQSRRENLDVALIVATVEDVTPDL